MTNREWLNTLSNDELVYQIIVPCDKCVYASKNCKESSEMDCFEGCIKWLEQEHEGGENE